MDFEARLGLF